MKIIYLVPQKIYLERMSRVRFHQIEEIAKISNLKYSGPGWDNYNDDDTVIKNLNRIYNGNLPDIIIAFDHRTMKEFKYCPIPKINMMNEMHSPNGDKKAGLDLLNSAGYDFIICHHENEMNDSIFNPIRYKLCHIPHHANASIFKDYNLEKTIDVLLCGALFLDKYKLRIRFIRIIKKLQKLGINAEIHQHPGGYLPDAHTNKYLIDFARKINMSKICLTCSSIYKCAFAKYVEIPLCNSLLAGDIPADRQNFFKSFMLELEHQTDEDMIKLILELLTDKERLSYLTKVGFDKSQIYSMDNYAKIFIDKVDKFLTGSKVKLF